jgi:hypothetical protein
MTHLTCSFTCVSVCWQDVITFAPSVLERPLTHHPSRHKNNPARRPGHRQHLDLTTFIPYLSTGTRKYNSPAPSYCAFHSELPQQHPTKTATSQQDPASTPSCPTSATTARPAISQPGPVFAILSSARSATPGVTSTSSAHVVSPSRTEATNTGVSVA